MKTILTAALLAMVSVIGAFSQWQPSGQIKFLNDFRAIGRADTVTSMLAEKLTAECGWKIILEDMTGQGKDDYE